MGRLLNASHVSFLRNNVEVFSKELNALVGASIQPPDCEGARLTGAGFGGSAIALAEGSQVADFCQTVEVRYNNLIGCAPTFYEAITAGEGVRELLPLGEPA